MVADGLYGSHGHHGMLIATHIGTPPPSPSPPPPPPTSISHTRRFCGRIAPWFLTSEWYRPGTSLQGNRVGLCAFDVRRKATSSLFYVNSWPDWSACAFGRTDIFVEEDERIERPHRTLLNCWFVAVFYCVQSSQWDLFFAKSCCKCFEKASSVLKRSPPSKMKLARHFYFHQGRLFTAQKHFSCSFPSL